ncbi:hypothetical protein COMA2_30266 [Candidatus Nitrospira nitrificans]|uniref:Uncharacterized protein n=1 Tax=Candidatus Nitrospira nitrificans TaxID=1742973 RepID=A0A0S4LLF1_9BACT|nr:hypothetical protein COMA2_30266 [Candidatus Nitrospira nitrificans]
MRQQAQPAGRCGLAARRRRREASALGWLGMTVSFLNILRASTVLVSLLSGRDALTLKVFALPRFKSRRRLGYNGRRVDVKGGWLWLG